MGERACAQERGPDFRFPRIYIKARHSTMCVVWQSQYWGYGDRSVQGVHWTDREPSRCGEFRFQWETLSHKMRWKAVESDTKCWFLDSKYTYIGKYACTHTSTTHTHTHTQPNTQVHPYQPLRSGSFHPIFAKNWVVMEKSKASVDRWSFAVCSDSTALVQRLHSKSFPARVNVARHGCFSSTVLCAHFFLAGASFYMSSLPINSANRILDQLLFCYLHPGPLCADFIVWNLSYDSITVIKYAEQKQLGEERSYTLYHP